MNKVTGIRVLDARRTIISQSIFVEDTALALMSDIRNPDGTYSPAKAIQLLEQIVEHGLVHFLDGPDLDVFPGYGIGRTNLGKAIGMCCNKSNVARLRV